MTYVAKRITIDPKICDGRPTIRSSRITVNTILEFLAAGDFREEILYQYPFLEPEYLDACLQFAADLMNRKYGVLATAA